jgi:predicted RNA-binding protein (TIGR00451 family)
LKRWVLSRRDSVDLISRVESSLGIALDLPKSAQAECAEPAEGVVFVKLGDLEFVQEGDRFVPPLWTAPTLSLFPGATVDEGAIRFLLNGADVMRPGIKKFDDWGEAGKIVVVREEKKGRAIAIGLSTVSSGQAKAMAKGMCLKNLHRVGDRYWNLHRAM